MKKTRVSVKVTYECGKCGNVQVRTFTAENGLLTIPQVFCGCCVKSRGVTEMSATCSDAKVEDLDAEADSAKREVQGLGGGGQSDAGGAGAGAAGGKKG